ncbi:sodium:solute symporter family protein [Alloacidobacterium sp.]|uniref:sodium:solute symporter family protein n=1 Tax=Alloacidobacterium sp. TaxID=2951999 RepID=UPI002D57C636|nr:sodium:solute symporter family protein [Alloacidobacterium sp.]HYK37050.1 sodium:solute symporter family protein [Alloacidobacterium sp.]
MSHLYAVVVGAIVLTLLVVSLTRLGKVKTKADYLVAGRTLPAFVLVFTLLSSWIGSGSLLGAAENAYNHGFVAIWQAAGGWAGLLLIYFIAPRARRSAQFTIPDLLEARYNQTARVLGVIAVLFAYTAITSYQFIGGGDILSLIFPNVITPVLGEYIIAAFVIVFTAIAGMSSVAYMDVFIGLLATITMLIALPVLMHSVGGWSGFHASLPPSHFTALGDDTFMQALELFVPTCLLMLGNQAMYQKFFSAKSEKDARVAVVGWIIGTVILETVIVVLAMLGHVLAMRKHESPFPREILAFTSLHSLPGLLGALLMGAIFAKIVSTANNFLFSPATNLVNDIFVRYISPEASNKRILIVSRLMVVLLGVWALYQALHTGSVLKKTLYAYTIYSAALTPVILAAFYSKRANAAGAVSAIFAGTFITVFWDSSFIHNHLPAVLAQRDAIFPALIVAVLCLVVVSAFTQTPRKDQVAIFFGEQA